MNANIVKLVITWTKIQGTVN